MDKTFKQIILLIIALLLGVASWDLHGMILNWFNQMGLGDGWILLIVLVVVTLLSLLIRKKKSGKGILKSIWESIKEIIN